LVIPGTVLRAFDFASVQFDEASRIRIPARFVDQAKLTGEEPITCWLLVVTVGRYRVLIRPDDDYLVALAGTLSAEGSIGDDRGGVVVSGGNERAAILARLIRTSASPKGPGWRIVVPTEAKLLVPANEDRSFMFVLSVNGYVELWFPDTLRRAMSKSVFELF